MTKRWWLLAGVPLLSNCSAPPSPHCGLLGGGGILSNESWNGLLVDGGVTDGGFIDQETCVALCPPSANMCAVVQPGVIECSLRCTGGRAPPGLVSLSDVDASAGSWLARMAELEAAAVHAFEHLANELEAHGLHRFATHALQAAEHEIRHAKVVTGLALRAGYCPKAPVMRPAEVRSLAELAVDNAGEGCGRELFGAELNVHQARTASDPEVARVIGGIVDDERHHAAFSFALAEALMPRLTLAQRRRAREAQAEVLQQLGSEDVPLAARQTLGLMDQRQAAALAGGLLDQYRLSRRSVS